MFSVILFCLISFACAAPTAPVQTSVSDEPSCALCELVLQILSSNLPTNFTEAELEQDIDVICEHLPKTLTSACEAFVHQYSQQIFDDITGKVPPQQVCTSLKLCHNATTETSTEIALTKADNDVACAICEFVLKELAQNLPKNFTEQELDQDLDNICEKLPKTVTPECESLVVLFGHKIFEAITGGTPPDQVCTGIKLCNTTVDVVEAPKPVELTPVTSQVDPGCAICEFVLSVLAQELPKNFTEQELAQDLDNICEKLPKTVAPECEALVTLFGQKIFDAITGQTPPDQVCTGIKLCHNSTSSNVPAQSLPSVSADEPCVICEYILTTIAKDLPKNFTEQELEQDLDNVCEKLPSSVTTQCEALVKLFGPKIFDAITGGTPPDQVCTELHLCHNSTNMVVPETPVEKRTFTSEPKVVDAPFVDPACAICEFVLQELAQHLPKNFTEAELEQDLDNICEKLPATITPECEALVKLFGQKIFEAITGGTPPQEVCTEIKLCHNSTLPDTDAIVTEF